MIDWIMGVRGREMVKMFFRFLFGVIGWDGVVIC